MKLHTELHNIPGVYLLLNKKKQQEQAAFCASGGTSNHNWVIHQVFGDSISSPS